MKLSFRSHSIRHFCLISLIFLFSLVDLVPISNAQSPTKEVDIEVEKIKAPPRDIKDILRVLEQAKPDQSTVDRSRAIIAMPVPQTEDKEELNNFYQRRSKAYQNIGKINLAIADAAKAAYEFPSSNPRYRAADFINLGVLEGLGGRNTNAIKAYAEAKKIQLSALPNQTGFQVTTNRLIVTSYAFSGNFEAAKDALDSMETLMFTSRRSRGYFDYGTIWESGYESARGIFFSSQGKWVESERALRRAIRLLEENYKKVQANPQRIDTLALGPRQNADATNNPDIYITQITNRELNLAFVLLQQRRLIDAEYYARKSLQLSLDRFGRGSTDVGRALQMLARIVNEQGRPKEAVLLAEAAQRSALEGGATNDSIVMAQSRRALGTALVVDGQYTKADQVFQEMLAGIQADPDLAKNFVSEDLDWVMAMLKIGKFQPAEQMAKSLLVKTERASGKSSPRLAIVRAFEASALQGLNKPAEANSLYKLSIPILVDQSRNDAENDSSSIRQVQRLKFLFENYLAGLAETAKSSPSQMPAAAAEAFTIADIARGSGVQRALTASAARANIKDPQLANLARKEQDLQRRINTLSELLTGLLSAAPDQQLPTVQAKIRSDISLFKSEREGIKKEIEKKFPDYAELVEPKPATIERTQKLLRADEVLVSFYFADQVGYIWAISKQGPVQFVQIPVGRSQIAKQVAHLRKSLDPGVSTIDEIPAFDVAASYRLYQQILEPVASGLQGKNVMLVVPHAELGQLPLSVLITKPVTQPSKTGIPFSGYKNIPWLAKEIGIAQIPSVTALTALRNLPEGNASRKNFIGFGDPYFSAAQQKSAEKSVKSMQLATRGTPLKLRNVPKTSGVSSAELALLPRLPDTSEEIQDIAKVMSASPEDIFLHQKASVKQVMTMDLSNRKVVIFATHGLVPGELNGLTQPALAMSSPEVTGDPDDGLLTMDQVLTLKLDADWVVLSACNTASGDGSGSEAVSGLGRAFFFAGAKALLVSNWPVDSAASRTLMTDLFKRQQSKGMSKAEALKESMVAQIEQGGLVEGKSMKYSYAHPLFWAPFVVVGD